MVEKSCSCRGPTESREPGRKGTGALYPSGSTSSGILPLAQGFHHFSKYYVQLRTNIQNEPVGDISIQAMTHTILLRRQGWLPGHPTWKVTGSFLHLLLGSLQIWLVHLGWSPDGNSFLTVFLCLFSHHRSGVWVLPTQHALLHFLPLITQYHGVGHLQIKVFYFDLESGLRLKWLC